jgi:hypothetical protein
VSGKDIYLHVGLPKTGTTSLQLAANDAQEDMRARGVLFPGGRHHHQRRAAYDLLGRRVPGDEEPVAGVWRALVEEIHAYDGPTVLFSEELLGLARPRAIRRLAGAFPHDRLHVVLGVRDLARTLMAAWQQEVVRGETVTWADYIDAVRDPRKGVRAGVAFWLRHDPLRVLDAWETVVPRERFHLVTVPVAGAPPGELLDRLSRAVGLPAGTLPRDITARNKSLGVAGVEVVRRLNLDLQDRLPRRQYIHVVEDGVRRGFADFPDRPLRLPAAELPWVRGRATAVIDELRQRGYAIEGHLDELVPPATEPGARPIDDLTETELLEATSHALTSVARAHGALFRRYRRAFVEQRGVEPGRLELLGSASRAAGFRARVSALERADRSRVLGWAARQYLRQTSGAG